MTPQELKASILQLAIQGKLVEQRPEEGTAAELLRDILTQRRRDAECAEKNFRAETPRRRGKADAAASSGPGCPVSPSCPVPPADAPFDIPESWVWVRLGECVSNRAGLAYSRGNLDVQGAKMIRVLRGGNIADMGYCTKPDDVMISDEFVNAELFLRRNMLITPAVTSLDHVGKMARIEGDYDDMVVGGFVLMLTPHLNDDVFSRYLLCACSSKYFRDCCRTIVNKSGQAFYNLSRTKMMDQLIPLPPLAEQKRIVVKIEELLPLIDRYEKAWSKLEDFNKRFPVDMQKSLLQMAIQSKLVEQRPEEGTAAELLEKILATKNAKGAKGNLTRSRGARGEKKTSALSASPREEIPDDEKPFDIPESWVWVRLGEVGSWGSGATPSRTHAEYFGGSIPWLKTGDLNDGYVSSIPETITDLALEETSVRLNPVGSVLMAMYGATIGKLGILQIAATTNQACCACIPYDGVWNKYLFYYLMARRKAFIKMGEGGAQPNISKEKIVNALIPLPPLAEQKRIVAKLEELLPLCERLK